MASRFPVKPNNSKLTKPDGTLTREWEEYFISLDQWIAQQTKEEGG